LKEIVAKMTEMKVEAKVTTMIKTMAMAYA